MSGAGKRRLRVWLAGPGLCAVLSQRGGDLGGQFEIFVTVTHLPLPSRAVHTDVVDDGYSDHAPTHGDHVVQLDGRRAHLQRQGRPLVAAAATGNRQVCRAQSVRHSSSLTSLPDW